MVLWCYNKERCDMAYFLKKSNLKKGTYLQIYESFYDPSRKQTAHKSYKALGYVDDLIQQGIEDPIAFYKEEVAKLNAERREKKEKDKVRQISEETPEKSAGYFPLKSINDSLGVKKYLDFLQLPYNFGFNIYEMLSALIYARAVQPCSKYKTYTDVLPKLLEKCTFSLNQLYSGLEFMGSEYEKIIEIYNHQVNEFYHFDTSHTYFDCTNFYFEIDREDDFRRKGPSKENRRDPIVGLGLLLDANRIPIGMKLYPGNESERPVIRNVLQDLKQRGNISGRTIRVADKGLNCAENIFHAVKNGDGYIFSKSVLQLPDKEKVWVLLPNDYTEVKDKNGNLRYKIKECIDDFPYQFIDENGKIKKFRLTEKRIVTYNPHLAKKKKLEIDREVEKARSLKASQAKRSEYGDSAKYVTFSAADKKGETTDGKVMVAINEEKIEHDKKLAGYNMIVTSEIHMEKNAIYDAYHNLWRIEESFRVMKSQLDARPVYLQKKETITGHFLICYLTVLLIRLLQFKILKGEFSSETLCDFFREFRVIQISEQKYINVSKRTDFIDSLAGETGLPLTSFFLNKGQLSRLMKYRFK